MSNLSLSRLEEFRQLKKEIRGSEEHLIVGIDVAKEKHHAFFGTATGKSLLRRLVFGNNKDGFASLLSQGQAIQAREGLRKIVFGVEPTADYHKPLAEHLIKNGWTVVLVSNNASKNNRELLDGRWDKNDTKDCANVADLISQGKFLYYDFPSPLIRDTRHLLSLKRKLKKYEHSIRMRIRNHLVSQFFPELDKYYGHREKENLAIIKWCLDPAQVAEMDFDAFFTMVTDQNRGAAQVQHLQDIHENAKISVGCAISEAVLFEAKLLVELLARIRESIKAVGAKIAAVCKQNPGYASLLSIPGIGPTIAATILATIGDPFRFSSANQVLKLAGLDLSAKRSGKNSRNVVPKISKKGNAGLRYALCQAATIATYRDKYFLEYFTKLIVGRDRERGIKTKMRVKVAAKMLVIAWTLLKKGGIFQGENLLKFGETKAGTAGEQPVKG